jgi:L-seryl-tRNA(Ser) seleniumtransferase
MTGFVAEVPVGPLAEIGPPVIVDIGSGLLDEGCPWLADGPPSWLRGEPAMRQTLDAGAALVCCSGDKLLGGPQAGIIAGRRELVERCARHPLARALRPGGLVLDALQATTLAYLRRDGDAIPFWRQASRSTHELRARAEEIVAKAGVGEVIESVAVPGAGALPGVEIPSVAIALAGAHAELLRAAPVPVVARVHDGLTLLDLRTVEPAQDEQVRTALAIVAEQHLGS